jgi:hypothetical protein
MKVVPFPEVIPRRDLPILFAAGCSLLFSVYLWFLVNESAGLFAATWVPSILALGAFVKAGRDQA